MDAQYNIPLMPFIVLASVIVIVLIAAGFRHRRELRERQGREA